MSHPQTQPPANPPRTFSRVYALGEGAAQQVNELIAETASPGDATRRWAPVPIDDIALVTHVDLAGDRGRGVLHRYNGDLRAWESGAEVEVIEANGRRLLPWAYYGAVLSGSRGQVCVVFADSGASVVIATRGDIDRQCLAPGELALVMTTDPLRPFELWIGTVGQYRQSGSGPGSRPGGRGCRNILIACGCPVSVEEQGSGGFEQGSGSGSGGFEQGSGSGSGGFEQGSGSGSGGFEQGSGSGSGGFEQGSGSGSGGFEQGSGSGSGELEQGSGSGSGELEQGSGSGGFEQGSGSGSGGFEQGSGSGSGGFEQGSGSGSGGFEQGSGSGSGELEQGSGSGSGELEQGSGSGSGELEEGAWYCVQPPANGAWYCVQPPANGAWYCVQPPPPQPPPQPPYTLHRLMLNGTDQYVDFGNPPALQITGPFTVSIWIIPAAIQYSSIIGSYQTSGYGGWALQMTPGGNLMFLLSANGTAWDAVFYGGAALEVGTLYHVVFTYDGSHGVLWLNGSSQTSGAYAGGVAATNQPVMAGYIPGFGYYFDGSIDAIRIYNGVALTSAQVSILYGTVGGNPPGLSTLTATGLTTAPDGWWKFDDQQYFATDSSGNGFNGAEQNDPVYLTATVVG